MLESLTQTGLSKREHTASYKSQERILMQLRLVPGAQAMAQNRVSLCFCRLSSMLRQALSTGGQMAAAATVPHPEGQVWQGRQLVSQQ